MKTLHSLIYLVLLVTTAHASDMESHAMYNGALTIQLPTELQQLTELTLNKRFGKQKTPPNYAFSDKDQNISFTFTQYSTPANKKNMNKIHKSLSSMLRKSSGKAKWKKDKVYTRLGTKIAIYEYEQPSIGKYQYNITHALPINGKLTFMSFITTDKKYKSKWVELARKSLDSIVLLNQ